MGLCELAGFILAGVIYFTSYDGLNGEGKLFQIITPTNCCLFLSTQEINKSTVVIVLFCILGIPTLLLTCTVVAFCTYYFKNFSKLNHKKKQRILTDQRNQEKLSHLSNWCRFESPLFNPKQPLTLDQLTVFQKHRLPPEDVEPPHSGKGKNNPGNRSSQGGTVKFKTVITNTES